MRKLSYLMMGLVLLFSLHVSNAQDTPPEVKGLLTADSLASGNLKDLLTSFFQLSFNNLTGSAKEVNFNSNPFAVLLKTNPAAAIDTNYVKYKILRKFNFAFGLRLDTSYHFNGFSSGIRYAIINKRDSTTSKLLFKALGNDPLSKEINILQDTLTNFIDNLEVSAELKLKYQESINTMLSDENVPFNQLDTAFQSIVKKIAQENKLNNFLQLITSDPRVIIRQASQIAFNDLKKELQKKLLWTLSLNDTTYKDQFLFSNIVVRTELLKGMGKSRPGSNWEYSIPAKLNFLDDTLRSGRDLKRMIFTFEPGINLLIRNKANEQSFLELEFNGEYRHNFSQLYEDEKRDVINFIGTLRVRIFGDIWVPLQFRYEPDNGDFFGFLSVRFNFSGQNKKEKSGLTTKL